MVVLNQATGQDYNSNQGTFHLTGFYTVSINLILQTRLRLTQGYVVKLCSRIKPRPI